MGALIFETAVKQSFMEEKNYKETEINLKLTVLLEAFFRLLLKVMNVEVLLTSYFSCSSTRYLHSHRRRCEYHCLGCCLLFAICFQESRAD